MRWRGAALLIAATACTDSKPSAQSVPQTPAALASTVSAVARPESSADEDSAFVAARRGATDPTATLCGQFEKEPATLACAEGSAYRHGDTLFVRATSGLVTEWIHSRGREMSSYREYAGMLRGSGGAPSFHLVEHGGGEVLTYTAVDVATADSVILSSMPSMSPDGRRYIVQEDQDLCGYVETLGIWRITTGRPAREWGVDLCGSSAVRIDSVTWRSADTLALAVRVSSDSGGHWLDAPGYVMRVDTGWALDSGLLRHLVPQRARH